MLVLIVPGTEAVEFFEAESEWFELRMTSPAGGVGDAGLGHLKGLTDLRMLNLGQSQIGDAGLAHLKGMAELQTLIIDRTKVSDAGLAHHASRHP